MEENPRERWNRIYRNKEHAGSPAAVLTENQALLTQHAGKALDIACGTGINALMLAEFGFDVEAWDISDEAINQLNERRQGACVQGVRCDITAEQLRGRRFDLILNCHYLDRSLFAAMKAALNPGGLICFQTFHEAKKLSAGPGNPDYLLKTGELRAWLADTEILAARDASTSIDDTDSLAGREYIIARINESPAAC